MITENYTFKHLIVTISVLTLLFVANLVSAASLDNAVPFGIKAVHRAKQVRVHAVNAVNDVVCTAEVKQCADGTSVGRVGPNCEFAPCSGERRRNKARNIFKRLKVENKDAVADWRQKKNKMRADVKQLRGHVKERRNEVKSTVKAERARVKAALQTAETPEERQAIREEARAKAIKFREKIKAERLELKKKVKARISEHMQQILKRLSSMHNRLIQLNARIQSFLDKLVEKGVDTSKAQEYLNTAKSKVSAANDAIHRAKALIEEAVTAEKPADYRGKVREAVRNAINLTKEAKKAIRDAIRAARNAATN